MHSSLEEAGGRHWARAWQSQGGTRAGLEAKEVGRKCVTTGLFVFSVGKNRRKREGRFRIG